MRTFCDLLLCVLVLIIHSVWACVEIAFIRFAFEHIAFNVISAFAFFIIVFSCTILLAKKVFVIWMKFVDWYVGIVRS